MILFIIINLYNFAKTMCGYYENSKIYNYNINQINNFDKKENVLYLKKLKYADYAFHMPEKYLYFDEWYRKYYNLGDVNIIWN